MSSHNFHPLDRVTQQDHPDVIWRGAGFAWWRDRVYHALHAMPFVSEVRHVIEVEPRIVGVFAHVLLRGPLHASASELKDRLLEVRGEAMWVLPAGVQVRVIGLRLGPFADEDSQRQYVAVLVRERERARLPVVQSDFDADTDNFADADEG